MRTIVPGGVLRSPALFTIVPALFSALVVAEPLDRAADAHLAVDQQRASVVERIVGQWGPTLARSKDPVSIDELRDRLMRLRADALLAASLAGTEEGVRDIAGRPATGSSPKLSTHHAKALGDSTADVVYTPVTPCRLVETRGTFSAVYQGGNALHTPAPFAPDEIRTYTVQAGNGVCLSQLPASLTPSAVQLQVFGMPTTPKSGDIEILPQGSAFGSTATMVYVGTIAFNTVSTATKVNVETKQISVQVRGGGAHLAVDVVGFFSPPSGNRGDFFRQGGNAFGAPAFLGTADTQPLTIAVNGQAAVRYFPNAQSPNILGGHADNSVDTGHRGQVVAGGGLATSANQSLHSYTVIGGGFGNVTSAQNATIGGGQRNTASGFSATVAGGALNVSSSAFSSVAGGTENAASGPSSTVGGGSGNVASAGFSAIAGGSQNVASGVTSVIPGGTMNVASGFASFAAGNRAKANADGTFVWGDSQPFDLVVPFSNNFVARATGGFMLISKVDGSGNAAESCTLTAGTPGWSCTSDRAAKENFVVADGVDVLQRLAAMPLYSWNFKGAANVRSIGPIAQDFHAAFGLGANAKTVAATNVAGVALAAIQGLHRVVLEKDARIDALERELHVARDIHQMELAELRRALQVLSSKMESSMR